jgi:hypothetical protein
LKTEKSKTTQFATDGWETRRNQIAIEKSNLQKMTKKTLAGGTRVSREAAATNDHLPRSKRTALEQKDDTC